MSLISTEIEGKLTGKQKQALETIENIIQAFYDEKCDRVPRSWRQLKKITGLSAGALSKHLKELIRQEVLKGKVIINEKNQMEIVYEYTEEIFYIKGEAAEPFKEVCRIYKYKELGGSDLAQWGYLKKGKRGSRYFVPSSEKFKI